MSLWAHNHHFSRVTAELIARRAQNPEWRPTCYADEKKAQRRADAVQGAVGAIRRAVSPWNWRW